MSGRSFLGAAWLALACAGGSVPAGGTAPQQTFTLAELQARIDHALPGDTIVVPAGVYTAHAAIVVRRAGTASAPIRIVAATPGGVTIGGEAGFEVSSPASYVEIVGFVFTHAAGSERIDSGATHIRFSHNIFQCSGAGAYLTIAGDDAEVDRNEFRDKKTLGNMIDVRGGGIQVARRVHIHDNYFHDFSNAGGNGAETIRFGLSGLSLSRGQGLIENNLFLRCTGENELISVKSGANTIRYNTFLDSPGAQLTLRHGNENLVYGNYFRGTDGIRIYGDRNQVFSNYLEGNTGAIDIGNGDGDVEEGAPLTSHDRPDGDIVVFNTLVNNGRNYYMTGRSGGLGATGAVFADNIVQGGGAAAAIAGPYTDGTWSGNLVWQTNGAGDMPAGTFDAVDPLVARDGAGLFRPSAASPAQGSAVGDYPAVTVDMDGQPRAGRKDRGADQLSTAPVVAHMLTVDDILRVIRGL